MFTWTVAKLGSLIELKYGKSLPDAKRIVGRVPVYGSNGRVGWHAEKLVNGPCLIVGRKGSIGEVTYSSGPCWPIDTTFYVDDVKGSIKFYYYLLKYLKLNTYNSDSAVPGLNRSFALGLSAMVPDHNTQIKVAYVLSVLQKRIEQVEQKIELCKQLKRSIMEKLFTEGLRGEKPKYVNLGKILKLNYGKALQRNNRKEGNVPVYGSNGIVGYHNIPLITTSGIILGRKGSVGAVHFSQNPFYPIDTTYYVVQNETDYDLKYVYYLLTHANLARLAADVGIPGLNRENAYLEKVLVLKNLNLQKVIVNILDTIEIKIAHYNKQNRIYKDIFKTLLNNLMSQKITVDNITFQYQNEI